MTVSALDCTGCGSCATVCPGMKGNKALVMQPLDTPVSYTHLDVYKRQDQEKVVSAIRAMVDEGQYPVSLWG